MADNVTVATSLAAWSFAIDQAFDAGERSLAIRMVAYRAATAASSPADLCARSAHLLGDGALG